MEKRCSLGTTKFYIPIILTSLAWFKISFYLGKGENHGILKTKNRTKKWQENTAQGRKPHLEPGGKQRTK